MTTRTARGGVTPTRPSTTRAVPDGNDQLVDTDTAARILDVTFKWLLRGRAEGFGPPYVRLGPRLVRYRVSALMDYAEANTTGGGAS